VLETVLLNRLDGHFSGPIACLVTSDIYSHDRQHLLVPAGAKLLGETRKVESFGQTRLAVSFHRLVMPDGYSASLDRFQGLNQIGDAGLRDQVNTITFGCLASQWPSAQSALSPKAEPQARSPLQVPTSCAKASRKAWGNLRHKPSTAF